MENNQIYSSLDESQIDGTIFVVDIEANETSLRLKLRGEYSLRIWNEGISLLSLNTEQALFYWPFTVLRRYGTSKSGFTFEAGRKSKAGPGVLRFSSPSGKLITQTIKETVNKIKEYNCLPNTDSPSPSPSLRVTQAGSSTFGEDIADDYTKYSKTTDRPKRRAKQQEVHTELSLEIPGQYNSNRMTAGLSLSNPVSHAPPKERPRPPTYYNEYFHRPVGPIVEYSGSPSLGQPNSQDYNVIGDNSLLIDNYSLSSPQGPASLKIIDNVPIHSPRAKSPSVPLPYKSFQRGKQLLETPSSPVDQFIKLEESTRSDVSTFPTCVSPLPKALSSQEDSSSDDENSKKPAIRKISQAQISRTELTADLELKAVNRNSPVCENYVNLQKEQLIKTLSNPGITRTKDEFKLAGPEHHSYINVSRQQIKEADSDYYNVTPDLLPEDKRRSYTDTIEWKKRQQSRIDSFEFSPSCTSRGGIQAGPLGFLNLDNLSIPTSETEDIEYGMFSMHPSSRTTNSQQDYVNTKPTFRKVGENNRSNVIEESNYTFQSDITITNTHISTLPNVTQVPTPYPCLNSNQTGTNTTHPVPPKQTPRPYTKKISSEYSYLIDIRAPPPNASQAYNSSRGLPAHNKQ